MKKSIFIIALAVVAAACNNNLKQQASADIFGKEWRLSELNGAAVVLDTIFPKQPYLVFEKENRVSGNLGCNGFGGNLELQKDNGIKMSEITATQMACPNLKVEQEFLEVLKNAKSFRVEDKKLKLLNDKEETTAQLEVR